MCDEIINAADSVSTNGSNVMNAVSTNFHKEVRYKMDYHILCTFLSVIPHFFKGSSKSPKGGGYEKCHF